MEHFNNTIYNGRLVSTRKGIITSKSNHQGTRFVNSFASPAPASSAPPPPPPQPTRASATRQHREVRPSDDEAPSPDQQDETLMTDIDAHRMNSPPQTATTPSSIAAMPRTTEPPETPMSNASEAMDSDDQPSSSRPGTAATQHSLNIGYLRPPVPKGNPTTHTPPPRRSARSQPPPDDDTAALAQRLVQQYLHNVPQRSHTYEAIALVASLANGGGSVPPAELGPSISRVCASMNRALLMSDDDGRRSELAVVESIAAMAIEATYLGRQDHWHVLMRGLRDIVDRGGGMKAEWGDTLNKIRKADVKGAAYSGSSPYLDFHKVFPTISDALPPHRRAELAVRTGQILTSCNVAKANIDSMQALAFFTQTVAVARHASSARNLVLDPQGFAEDCLQVEHQLVRYPKGLRAEITEAEAAAAMQGQTPNTETGRDDSNNPLNSLIRVAALLYIEDLLPDSRSVDLFTILLTVLIHQTQTILQYMIHRHLYPDALPDADSVRPVLLWVCMVGYAVTGFTNAQKGTRLNGSVFEDCAGLALAGAPLEEERDDVEGDLGLCEMLPLSELRSVGCDGGTLLRQMIAGLEARQGWRGSSGSCESF